MSNLIPNPNEHNQLREYAKSAVAAGLFAGIQNPHQALIIMMQGLELNMGPVWALQNVYIVKGRPTLKAEGMLGLVYKNVPTAQIDFIQNDNQACVIEASRNNSKKSRFSFTMEDAKRAGLGGVNWSKYPRAMLRSRCVSEMCRAMFPDALMGVSYTPEDLEDNEIREVTPVVDNAPSLEPPKPSVESTPDDNNTSPVLEPESPKEQLSIEDINKMTNEALSPHYSNDEPYIMPMGKFKNEELTSINRDELRGYIDYCRKKYKDMNPKMDEMLQVAEAYLNAPVPDGEFDSSEQIPW